MLRLEVTQGIDTNLDKEEEGIIDPNLRLVLIGDEQVMNAAGQRKESDNGESNDVVDGDSAVIGRKDGA